MVGEAGTHEGPTYIAGKGQPASDSVCLDADYLKRDSSLRDSDTAWGITCPYHHYLDAERNDHYVMRPGVAVGLPLGTKGMLLENASVTCIRVVSIELLFNQGNVLEVGAYKWAYNPGYIKCVHAPVDNTWRRFWFMYRNGTPYCSVYYALQGGATYHQVAIYRDGADYALFHLEWDFTDYWHVYNKFMTGGMPLMNWERFNDADPGYSEWDGIEYMDRFGNFYLWNSVCYYGYDAVYGLDVTTPSHIRFDATPNGSYCP